MKKINLPMEKIIRRIKNGRTLKQMSEEFEGSPATIARYVISQFGKSIKDLRKEAIQKDLKEFEKEGKPPLFLIRERYEIPPYGFYNLMLSLGKADLFGRELILNRNQVTRLRRGLGNANRPDINEMIDAGKKLEEMAEVLYGSSYKSHSLPRQYICGSGQHRYWRMKRNERDIVGLIRRDRREDYKAEQRSEK